MEKELNKTVAQIARLVDGEVVGEGDATLRRIAAIDQAAKGDLTFVTNDRYARYLRQTPATAAIVGRRVECDSITLIRVANPDLAVARIVGLIAPAPPDIPREVSNRAWVAPSAAIGKGAAIGPFAVIEERTVIGEGTTIHAGAYIGHETRVGRDCIIYANVTIRERITIGDRVIIHSGTVIGSDGFGFAKVDGRNIKIQQSGTVQIDDDVEIGSNVSIDRARFDKTHVCRGAKIDNLVQIGHNVVIGEDCCIVALSGVAGSTTIGRGVTMAAQSGVLGHLRVGDQVTIAARGGVIKDTPAGSVVAGFPATSLEDYKRAKVAVRRLPDLEKRIRRLEKRIEDLERAAEQPKDDR